MLPGENFQYLFLGFIATVLFFLLDQKETKNQGCIFFAKIVRLVSEGAETRFAQTAAPSFRYKPPNFFTQKKRGRSFWSLGFAIAGGVWIV
jgi:hypothetical protein